MARTALDPEMAAALERARTFAMPDSSIAEPGSAARRDLVERECEPWNRGGPTVAARVAQTVECPADPVAVQLLYPATDGIRPAVVFLYGGGWCEGSVACCDRRMRALAQESGAVVVGVAYARAPEHPYPAALNQVVAVVEWLAEQGRAIGIDPARIGIAGVSAGANLALAACLRLRDRGQRLVAAAALYVGLFGANLDTPSYDAFDETDYGPSRRRVRTLFNLYAPGAAAPHDPYVVPLTADLAGLPDLYLAAAGVDTLRDDSTRLAARVREAGGRATIQVFDGVTHGFTLYQAMVGKARQAIAAGGAFLADRLERP